MLGDLRFFGKPRATEGAAVRFLAGVGARVVPKVVLLDKRPAADAAAERSVSRMHPLVVRATAIPGKGLVAVLAAEGALARVNPLVDDKPTRPLELFAAESAGEVFTAVDHQRLEWRHDPGNEKQHRTSY